jgi:DNA-directed RNA polymerase specialized sigma24 family protein
MASEGAARGAFPETRWSMVSAAQRRGEVATRALGELCARYWYPLYAFARRQGLSREDAEDGTQAFFARLVEKGTLDAADRERGKLRTFFLAAFKHFLADQHDHATRWKRGGRHEVLSFEALSAEERYAAEPSSSETPERLYHRGWALALLAEALTALEAERTAAGRGSELAVLRPFLDASGQSGAAAYETAAEQLGWSVNATRVAVHRLRARYREQVKATVAATLEREDPALVEEEMRALLAALA